MTLSLRDVKEVNTVRKYILRTMMTYTCFLLLLRGVKLWMLILCKTYSSNWGEKCISRREPHSKCPWNTEKMVEEELLDESQGGDLDCVQGWT